MKLEFLEEAESEFQAAIEFYESQEAGLGIRFRNEIAEVCSAVVQYPYMWREPPGGYRRVNCPIFPYYVAYFIRDETILIAAVAHGSRHPDYWKQRTR